MAVPPDPGGILTGITTTYQNSIQLWSQSVYSHVNYIIGILALVQIIWTVSFLALKGQDIDSMIATILKEIVIIGFFLTLIAFGGQWLPDIINSFIKLGAESGSITTLDPSSVFGQGLTVAHDVLKAGMNVGFLTHPFSAIMCAVISCVIIFSYIMIAADLVVTLVSVYIIYAVSCLFFAFGVSSLTSPMARNLIQKCIALGLKLMGLYVIVGIGTTLAAQWAGDIAATASGNNYYDTWFTVAGACVIFYLLTKNIPPLLSSLAGTGSLMTHGGETLGAVTAGAAAGKAAGGRGYHGIAGSPAAVKGGAIAAAGGVQSTYSAGKVASGAVAATVGAATGNATLVAAGGNMMKSGVAGIKSGFNTLKGGIAKAKPGIQRMVTGKSPQGQNKSGSGS